MLKVICAWRSGFDTRQLTTTWASSRAGIPLAAAHEPATSRLPQGYRATTMRCVRAVRAGEPLLAPAETYGHEQRDAAGPGVLDARGLHRATRLGRWCWCRRGRLEHSRSRVRAKRATPDRDSAQVQPQGGGRSGRRYVVRLCIRCAFLALAGFARLGRLLRRLRCSLAPWRWASTVFG